MTNPEVLFESKNQHPIRQAIAVTVAAAGIALSAAGCFEEDPYRNTTNTFAESCGEAASSLPTDTNTTQIEDERTGNIYACNYLDDLGVPYNQPTELYEISSNGRTTGSSFNSKSKYELHGETLFGTHAEGSSAASGASRDWRVTTLKFNDSEGFMQTIEVPSEKIRVGYCADDCEPTMTVVIPETPLFSKADEAGSYNSDRSSIWSGVVEKEDGDKVLSDYASKNEQTDGYHTDSGRILVMQSLTDEKGAPADTGQVVAALSSRIELRIPSPAK